MGGCFDSFEIGNEGSLRFHELRADHQLCGYLRLVRLVSRSGPPRVNRLGQVMTQSGHQAAEPLWTTALSENGAFGAGARDC